MDNDQDQQTVPTNVIDLGEFSLADLLGLDPAALAPTTAHLVARLDEPGRSISGYNPQRLDG